MSYDRIVPDIGRGVRFILAMSGMDYSLTADELRAIRARIDALLRLAPTRRGETFDEMPDPTVWQYVECDCENKPDGGPIDGVHRIDPCQGCAAWGEACGAIYALRRPDADPSVVGSKDEGR